MEVAALLAIILLDYADFALILGLLLLNATISFIEESNADKAIKALAGALAPKCRVRGRGGGGVGGGGGGQQRGAGPAAARAALDAGGGSVWLRDATARPRCVPAQLSCARRMSPCFHTPGPAR